MNVFRLHVRPTGGLANPAASFAYCLREGVLGVGWQVRPTDESSLTWERYLALAGQEHGADRLSRVRYLHDNVKPDDLIWTRDTNGRYYLAKVDKPRAPSDPADLAWEYCDTADGRNADIVNVVRCRILPVPLADDVPGKVVACFRPSKAIQPIRGEIAVLYSRLLWNELTGASEYELPDGHRWDVFAFLDAAATEDVIFIYLQYQGWIVVPNSRKTDTMSYEFLLIHRDTHERALVQVKTGNTSLETDSWRCFEEKVFLFQTHGLYEGKVATNAVLLPPATIREFMESNVKIMPGSVRRWIEFAERPQRTQYSPS